MSEEPMLPPIPDIGENVLGKRKRTIPREFTIIKCENCKQEITRPFQKGDHVFKKIPEIECENCHKRGTLTITEIYSEWYDPKKEQK